MFEGSEAMKLAIDRSEQAPQFRSGWQTLFHAAIAIALPQLDLVGPIH